jgi:hypothetical protein
MTPRQVLLARLTTAIYDYAKFTFCGMAAATIILVAYSSNPHHILSDVTALPRTILLLWLITIAANAIAIWRLYDNALARKFKFFLAYLIFAFFRSIALLPLYTHVSLYNNAWTLTAPVMWFCYIAVVVEWYSLLTRQYPSLSTLGRWTLYGALVISSGASLVTLALFWKGTPLVIRPSMIQRGVTLSLAIFLLIITILLRRYPLYFTQNLFYHGVICLAVFWTDSIISLGLQIADPVSARLLDRASLALGAGYYLSWAFLLTRSGELQVKVLHNSNSAAEQRLVAQLSRLNASILRFSHKESDR